VDFLPYGLIFMVGGWAAAFKSNTAFKDIFANLVLVNRNLVTGQNQNAGAETAQAMMQLLEEKEK
jgi:putative intracellular protease/amidase